MLGWSYNIWRQLDPEGTPAHIRRGYIADWDSGPRGLEWIKSLVEQGDAIDCGGNGYPLYFTMDSSIFRKQLINNPPCHPFTGGVPGAVVVGDAYVLPTSWTGAIELNKCELDACQPEEILSIEVWDLS